LTFSMVGIIETANSKWCRLSILLLYNPFWQTNGITSNANPSLLMFMALESVVGNKSLQ
jgi:hypothetical protein